MSRPPPRDRRDFEVAIICALPLEADAVHAVFDKFHKDEGKNYGQAPGDHNYYTTGVIGNHNVVLAHMPGMGTVNATVVAAGLLTSFTGIKLALVVGICGGVPLGPDGKDKMYLGDVVLSTGVIQYDLGRQYPKELQRKDTVEDSLGRPPRKIRGLIAQLKTKLYRKGLETSLLSDLECLQRNMPEAKYPGLETDLLFDPSYLHKHHDFSTDECQDCNAGSENICKDAPTITCQDLRCDDVHLVKRSKTKVGQASSVDCNPSIQFGVIASGNAVMKSGAHRDKIAKETGVIAFEMEGAGVWDFFPSIIIKGVCDYADSHKNKKWQEYAAATAASAMKAFLGQWSAIEDEQVTASQVLWHVPFNAKQGFVGRDREIDMLENKLLHSQGLSKVAVFGLGGAGKSRIALELAYRVKERQPECSVFWVQATDSLSFDKDILEIGKLLKIPGIDDDKADVKNLVKQRLTQQDAGEWLMILDNADDEDLWGPKAMRVGTNNSLTKFLPAQGRILITTRIRQIAVHLAGKDCIELLEMSKDEAVDMFKGALISHTVADDVDAASQLVEKLTYLPLAIIQAAAYINMNDATIRDYLEFLEDAEENVIDLLSEDFGDDGRYSEGQNPVASTWLISFEQMRQQRPKAANYLASISCLGDKSIPLSLLPTPASRREMVEVIGTLTGYSFLRKQNEELANEVLYQMHRLVRLATRNWLKKQSLLLDSIRTTLGVVEKRFQIRTHDNRDECALYMPHAQILCDSEGIADLEERYALMEKMGIHLVAEVKFTDALHLHQDVVVWREQHHGPAHPATLTAYDHYGNGLEAAGNWEQAKVYYERAFEGRKSLQGPNDESTLRSMNNLAVSYQSLGQWTKAEELGLQVTEASTNVLGSKHPDTLKFMASLVWTLYKQGRTIDAERLGLQVKQARVEVLSAEHPDTLISISHLGAIYQQLGRLSEAVVLKRTVLEVRTRVLGREHPKTLISMVNLAMTYRHMSRLDEAEALEVEALNIREKLLGPDHPSTLTVMNNLAWTLRGQGRHVEAVALIKRCIELSIQKLGEGHPVTQDRHYYWDYYIESS